jgi:hypothetical protein
VASENAFDAEPPPFEYSVFEQRLDHILAARGKVTARRRRQRRDKYPVEIYRELEKLA